MQLTLTKLGRIEQANLDIRPLTVFIGPNGTNKTWAAYLLHELLMGLSHGGLQQRTHVPADSDGQHLLTLLDKEIAPLVDAVGAQNPPNKVSIAIDVQELYSHVDSHWTTELTKSWVLRALGVPAEFLGDASAALVYEREEFALQPLQIEATVEPSLGRLSLRTTRARSDGQVSHFSMRTWSKSELLEIIYSYTSALIDRLLIFPAERKGLLVAIDRLDPSTEVTLLPAHAEFLAFARLGRTVRPKKTPSASDPLTPYLEKIVGGEILFGAEGGGEGPLALRLPDGRSLPLESASSLSRAVAGLSLYLNHFVTPNDVLIIDELEMNAHPEAQMGLVELIAMLVNRDVRVVVTTHSPYIVDHLNNLMEAARVVPEKQQALATKFRLGTPSAFISSEKVACHAFEEEKPGGRVVVRDVLDRKSGLIDWSTFSRVTERMSNLYNDVLKATV